MIVQVCIFDASGRKLADSSFNAREQFKMCFEPPIVEDGAVIKSIDVDVNRNRPSYGRIADQTHDLQRALSIVSENLNTLRLSQAENSKVNEYCSHAITKLAELSNDIMRLRMSLQP